MEPFKNVYNAESLARMADVLQSHHKIFKVADFKSEILGQLHELELKGRVILIAEALRRHLPPSFEMSAKILISCLKSESQKQGLEGFMVWPLTQYVEMYGLNHFDASMQALYEMTQRFTGEFGIRPFLIRYPEKTYKILEKWALDPNFHVRRLVSEGTRPNLPWGMKVPHITAEPEKNLALLEQLKNDPEEYVRRSVANHLNDISRIKPELTRATLKKWGPLSTPQMKKLSHRALRSLLKAGDPKALKLMGFDPKIKVKISKLKISKPQVREGDQIWFEFKVVNLMSRAQKIMLDYVIHYPKKNGKLSPKVFKLKSLQLKPKEELTISRKIDFKKVTTRIHYPGKHLLELQVNGTKAGRSSFQLVD